jgi:hypothetical protein
VVVRCDVRVSAAGAAETGYPQIRHLRATDAFTGSWIATSLTAPSHDHLAAAGQWVERASQQDLARLRIPPVCCNLRWL